MQASKRTFNIRAHAARNQRAAKREQRRRQTVDVPADGATSLSSGAYQQDATAAPPLEENTQIPGAYHVGTGSQTSLEQGQNDSASDETSAIVAELVENSCLINLKDRRVRLCLLVAVLGVIGLVVALVVSLLLDSDDDEATPAAPSAPSATPVSTKNATLIPSSRPTPPPSSTPEPSTRLSWIQVGSDIDGLVENDWLGVSVSLSKNGTRLAVGAPFYDRDGFSARGLAQVYEEKEGEWEQIGSDLLGEAADDYFSRSVAISGDGERISVGAYGYDDFVHGSGTGHVKVFEHQSGGWVLKGSPIVGEAAGDWFGWPASLSHNGDVVAVGARRHDGPNGFDCGQVKVYKLSSEGWTQLGSELDGEAAGDEFGFSVSLSDEGLVVAIGAPNNDGINASNTGHTRVYSYENGTWSQLGHDVDGEAIDDRSGWSVSISANGNIVAVGARNNGGVNGENSGHVRVHEFKQEVNDWVQLGSDIDGEAVGDVSASSVSLSSDGSILAVGALGNNGNGANSGHVRIYGFDGIAWVQVGGDIDGESPGDESGDPVSLSGDGRRVAIGAPFNDANGFRSGHVRVYDLRGGGEL